MRRGGHGGGEYTGAFDGVVDRGRAGGLRTYSPKTYLENHIRFSSITCIASLG